MFYVYLVWVILDLAVIRCSCKDLEFGVWIRFRVCVDFVCEVCRRLVSRIGCKLRFTDAGWIVGCEIQGWDEV